MLLLVRFLCPWFEALYPALKGRQAARSWGECVEQTGRTSRLTISSLFVSFRHATTEAHHCLVALFPGRLCPERRPGTPAYCHSGAARCDRGHGWTAARFGHARANAHALCTLAAGRFLQCSSSGLSFFDSGQ